MAAWKRGHEWHGSGQVGMMRSKEGKGEGRREKREGRREGGVSGVRDVSTCKLAALLSFEVSRNRQPGSEQARTEYCVLRTSRVGYPLWCGRRRSHCPGKGKVREGKKQ